MHKCVCKILTTRSVETDTISAISRTFTFGSSRILLIISGVVVSQGTLGKCPYPILFGLTYVVVLEKLSDTYFFLRAQNGFEGVNTTSEKCGTKYPFNCFTYNNRIFHNQTNSNHVLTIKDEKCDFGNLITNIFGGVNYPTITFSFTKYFRTGMITTRNNWKKYMLHAIIKLSLHIFAF